MLGGHTKLHYYIYFLIFVICSQVINCCNISVHFGGDVFQRLLINNFYQKMQSKYLKLQHIVYLILRFKFSSSDAKLLGYIYTSY